MRTYPLRNDDGLMFAFEIEHIGVRRVAEVLRRIEGVADVRPRTLFARPPDVRIRFTYRGTDCMVWEPFGDNSRLWIGPYEDRVRNVSMDEIERTMAQYAPPSLIRLVLDLVSRRIPFRSDR
jgi:hypothetical protein